MKLPTIKIKPPYFPQKALCPWCKKNKVLDPHSFAILTGGAMRMDQKRENGWPDKKMDGFLSLAWHGAHDSGEGKYRDINK